MLGDITKRGRISFCYFSRQIETVLVNFLSSAGSYLRLPNPTERSQQMGIILATAGQSQAVLQCSHYTVQPTSTTDCFQVVNFTECIGGLCLISVCLGLKSSTLGLVSTSSRISRQWEVSKKKMRFVCRMSLRWHSLVVALFQQPRDS